MPSVCHDGMAGRINTSITDWLKDVRDGRSEIDGIPCSDARTISIAADVEAALGGEVNFPKYSSEYHPDLSFRFRGPIFPGLVIEVAWSQAESDLQRKARRYIEYSNGDIRTVIGVSLNDIYGGRGTAIFSVWRAEFDISSGKARVMNSDQDQVCFLPLL
jgi:hypothetical protein